MLVLNLISHATSAQFNPSPALPNLVYANSFGYLGTIDTDTGIFTEIGKIVDWQTGMDPIIDSSLAIDSQGRLYATSWNGRFGARSLIEIDPATGLSRFIGNGTLSANLKGIAFDENDNLLAIQWEFRQAAQDVHLINTTDGTSSLLYDNALPLRKYGSLEKDPNGPLMYLSDHDFGNIHTLDPATGAINLIFSGDAAPDMTITDIAFGANGNLFAFGGNRGGPYIFEIDLANATTTKRDRIRLSGCDPDISFDCERSANAVTSFPGVVAALAAAPVPTMGEWGLIILALLLLIIGITALKQHQFVQA